MTATSALRPSDDPSGCRLESEFQSIGWKMTPLVGTVAPGLLHAQIRRPILHQTPSEQPPPTNFVDKLDYLGRRLTCLMGHPSLDAIVLVLLQK